MHGRSNLKGQQMEALKRAWRDTRKSLRRHGWPELGAAVLLFVATWITAREVNAVRQELPSALSAFLITVGVFGCYVLCVLAHYLHLASARIQIDTLQRERNTEANAAESERIRELRRWVGLIQGDVRDVRSTLAVYRERGFFWDPKVHKISPMRLTYFEQAGGLLAGDPSTENAHRACDELERRGTQLRDLVVRRYNHELDTSLTAIPYLFDYEPEIRDGDESHIAAVERACDAADNALTDAMQELKP